MPESLSIQLPESVRVPTQAVIEAAARSIALAEIGFRLSAFIGDETCESVREVGISLLRETTGLDDHESDTIQAFNRHPLVVEAHARAEELAGEWAGPFVAIANAAAARAERIRTYGRAYAALYDDSEIQREMGGDTDD